MTNKVILTEAGIIIINDKYEVLQSHRFEPNSEISLYSQIKNSNVSEDIKNFFDNSSNELPDSLEVNDQSLIDILNKIFPDKNFIHQMAIGLMKNKPPEGMELKIYFYVK